MNIVLIGLNHQTAPVELREKIALDSCEPVDLYQDLKRLKCVEEGICFSTCNRVEVLVTTFETVDQAIDEVKHFLAAQNGLQPRDFEDHLYVYEAQEAVSHLFHVVSSLDSMVVGEPQILGQIKASYRDAVKNSSSGVVLNKLLHKAFSVAKRVRTETGIANHAVSVSYAAVELARKIFGKLSGTKILLIGAGEMAELAAEHLLHQKASEIIVANRTLERALVLAKRFKGQAVVLEEIPSLLVKTDIVVSSTGSPETVVSSEMVRSVLKARKHRPLFFVDIAVPRDIDPNVNNLGNVYLYDIDDLKGVVQENLSSRADEAVRAKRIVEEETIKLMNWLETLDVAPTIIALKEKTEEIRNAELKRTINRLGELSEDQIKAMEVMTQSLVQKILHDPIMFIKNFGHHDNKDDYLELTHKLFNLGETFDQKTDDEDADQG
ncbi:MAG: glutamyl-tRNA reductase [Deltaproteobacteria bacterium]|nr:glutamyl-tRNA reductase [Deltaproteobacteria bacterium]MBW2052368.1 glutamyl-tRNA reductase [Deltaproteobacteria bacterium]MBW2140839.1 glutamyl-tRNA reductase [Deltaproteobacteria bacterium]MBW2323983.1 glutamyl-tRNA reductase [Deltaproteobacteria bacterium]